jgi:DNA-binding response OmpR family regulator
MNTEPTSQIPAKILLIEDDLTLVDMYQQKFALEHFVISVATDGVDGLEKALQEHPDVILLDLALPKMDGMVVLGQLRKDAWGKMVPVVILTNLSPSEEIIQQVVKNEPAYYLIKANTTPDDVIAKVKEIAAVVKKK